MPAWWSLAGGGRSKGIAALPDGRAGRLTTSSLRATWLEASRWSGDRAGLRLAARRVAGPGLLPRGARAARSSARAAAHPLRARPPHGRHAHAVQVKELKRRSRILAEAPARFLGRL